MDHFEDEDFGRRRRPRTTTYVGSYRRPGRSRYFNPASDILEGIEKTEKTIGQRKTKVRDFENAASQRRLELMQSLRETETMEDTDAMNDLQAELSKMVDDAYRLDIASFEGDRSAYNKKQSDLNNVLSNLPTIMGLIDAEGEAMKKAEESGVDYVKKILRDNNEDYVAFVQAASKGGKGIGFRIEGGNVIAQLNGKDVFNGNAFVKAKKNGVDLVNYAKDYSEQLAAVDKKAFEGLNKYITKESITRIQNNTATTEEKENFQQAMDIYIDRLENSELLTPLLNESTYQTYTNYGTGGDADSMDAWSNSDIQRAATKQAMAQRLIEQRFPDGIASITTSVTVKPDKPKGSGGGSGNKGTKEKADYSAWIKENLRKKKKVDVISGVTANRATGAGGSGGKVETKELDRPELETPEMFKVFYDKLVTVNPRYAYGSQVGQTGENANKVFKRVGNTIIPFSVTEEQLMNDEYLNNLLVSESIL